MNLSKQTIEVLKNFATINQGVVFKEGNVLRTMSVMRNIFARAVVADTFPKEFCVYDLPEFLSTMSLFDTPTFKFEEKHIAISQDSNRIKYFYSSPTVVVAPPDKEMKMKGIDISFKLTQTQLEQIQRAAGVMKLKDLAVTKNGVVVMNTNAPGNQYEVDTKVETELPSPNIVLPVENLKLIPADYDVNINSGGMFQFVSTTAGLNLEYFIAILA